MKVIRLMGINLILVLLLGCSTENELEIENAILEEEEKKELYKVWMDELEDYDLSGVIEEEKNTDLTLVTTNTTRGMQRATKSGKKLYVHYMPWFQTLEVDGFWGQHWTMTNKNPDVKNKKGKREIASHYYPLIGPYSTNDKYLQQYHLLLMKLCGVDGVIFDWYGSRDVLDFENIKVGMENFIRELEKTNLEFAVMYEDRVIDVQSRINLTELQTRQAIDDIRYIEETYFTNSSYIKIEQNPLLMIFGPNYIDNPDDWSVIFDAMKTEAEVLTLWDSSDRISSEDATGEYAWIDRNHVETLSSYFTNVVDFNSRTVGGVAYPRFNDYYIEGGWKPDTADDWRVKGRNLKTFKESFKESMSHPIDFIQVATWNDFGEGTQIEPTEEFGFKHLRLLQKYSGVSFSKEDLRIPLYIYELRKENKGNRTVQFLMDIAHYYAMKGNVRKAKRLIGLTVFYFGYKNQSR
ncbi:glycoside hydrolase family 71/99-like protein [Tenacibaculum sp. M341]|uniref:glycoside hydrolase family 71/99-like protein n=1 Tax=Tenacibaculum sp. M341 TaxID=2530339 RepID=UPI0014049131|nr:glycoside hydrolase family 71/99-like protein [Tenacibaculum sp. M341]